MYRLILTIFTVFLSIFTIFSVNASEKKLNILVSTYPVYQITRNITYNIKSITVDLLLPSELGCPHNYSLTPQDMRKLSGAEILIINGLGLEEFLGAPLKKATPDIKIIDTSEGIKNTINYPCTHSHHDHDHGVNPHLFVSPELSAKIAEKTAEKLSKVYPDEAVNFKKNSDNYVKRMKKLSAKFADLKNNLKNNRIIQPHGVFDYLARDIGLKIVATLMEEGQEPSASEMIKLVRIIKKEKVGAIISEPQYPDKIEKTLSRETNVPVIKIDPVASGPIDAPLDYFDKKMQQNLKKLKETLGKK